MERVYIFGDEFGTSSLNNNDVKNITHFVYSAIIIKASNLDKARRVRDEISNKFLSGNKIKSSSKSLRNNNKRRLEILNYLISNLDFTVHILVINKDELSKEHGGLRFKEVFYKYFQKIFIGLINNNYNDFKIVMDSLISEDYHADLKSYLANQISNSLFDNYEMSNDLSEPLIQFADLISGSFGRIVNPSFESEIKDDIFNILKSRIIKTSFFPPKDKLSHYKKLEESEIINYEIYNIVKIDAEDLIEQETDLIHKHVLNQLLTYQKISPKHFVYTYELLNSIKYYLGSEISTENLRIIIRDLRYKGIIIVSNTNKGGYKLAVNKNDVYQYFNHYLKYVIPMLQKVDIANSIFKSKTVGEFIPLEDMDSLKKLVESLTKEDV
ncbi:DUF3800 domain-containing protein [Arenibacter sp. ARW7G5Y1]|uniref:DUF3800 domain-containing protein n=1 Tax=Arenibacter sp. ARW7G5Y1 TaxID=2135619 RepID=UPI000D75488C|nr:DUF3800 domain-containing protein [Arenibacter sp. ARW7G5Y1]PXX22843.1 uncharacterized protein DUF3800 [Arenibacter sp. ARW7G5Y1]